MTCVCPGSSAGAPVRRPGHGPGGPAGCHPSQDQSTGPVLSGETAGRETTPAWQSSPAGVGSRTGPFKVGLTSRSGMMFGRGRPASLDSMKPRRREQLVGKDPTETVKLMLRAGEARGPLLRSARLCVLRGRVSPADCRPGVLLLPVFVTPPALRRTAHHAGGPRHHAKGVVCQTLLRVWSNGEGL